MAKPPSKSPSEPPSEPLEHRQVRRGGLLVGLLLTALVILTYAPCLDNYFWEIDDQKHVANGAGFPFPHTQFRPFQEWSFRAIYAIAGTSPRLYYVAGLIFHLLSTLLLFCLARRLFGTRADRRIRAPALIAAAAFATLFAPHQAVLWISAHEGVQEVLFSLAALTLWVSYLDRGGGLRLGASLICATLAMLCRQSGINLLPWMIILTALTQGPGDLLKPRRILALTPFMLLTGLILWRGLAVPTGTGLQLEWNGPAHLIGRLLRSLGHLPLPLEFQRWRFGGTGLQLIGAGLLALPLLMAAVVRRRAGATAVPPAASFRAALAAVLLLLGGHAAVLLVEPEVIGERSYYDAAPGFVLVLGVVFAQTRVLLEPWRPLRVLPWLGLTLFMLVNVRAIHEIERHKYDGRSRQVHALVESTRSILARTPQDTGLLFLDPPLPSTGDFLRLLQVWASLPESRTEAERFLPREPPLLRRLDHKRQERALRWDDRSNGWIPFQPGGNDWLKDWRPAWWPGGYESRNIGPWLRCVRVDPDQGD